MSRLAAALALALACAAPAWAQTPAPAAALFEQLKADPVEGRYWRAYDQAFPGGAQAALDRARRYGEDDPAAIARLRIEAETTLAEHPELQARASDAALLAILRSTVEVYRLSLAEGVGVCGPTDGSAPAPSPAVKAAEAERDTLSMEAAAAGRLTPVARPDPTPADFDLLMATMPKLPPEMATPEGVRHVPAARWCAWTVESFEAMLRLPPDSAGRIFINALTITARPTAK